jgi:hypothetical protein
VAEGVAGGSAASVVAQAKTATAANAVRIFIACKVRGRGRKPQSRRH